MLAVPNVILQAAYKELEQFNGEPQQPALYDKVSWKTCNNKCRQWNPDPGIFTDPYLGLDSWEQEINRP